MEIHVQNPTNNYNRPLPHKPRRRTSKPVEAPTRTPFLEDIDFKSWRDEAQACMAVPVIAPIIAEPEIHSTDLYERSDTPHEMAVPTFKRWEGLAKYSVEMQRRIRGTIYAHAGTDMWTDQTSSLLAAEMSADIIFGDGTEGNATPFDTGAAVLPDPVQLEADWIQRTAAVFRDAAQTELAYGHVQAAVATLETGVHKLLQDDNVDKGSSSWGFNYSMAVHAHATTIQTAMRAKLARKEVHARRQRKMLVRNLALFVKAWLVGYHSVKQRRLRLGHAQFCAQTKDRWIRGYVARYRVRQLKRRLELDEAARSSRERAYTVTNVAVKMADFQRQLISASKSSLGARRTRLTLQLKATASQRSDARKHLPPEAFRRAQVRDVFDAYDVDGSGTIDATELKSLFDELGIAIDRRGLHDALDAMDTDHNGVVDFDEFIHWLHSPPAQQGHRVRRLNRPELVYLKMKLNMKHLLNRFTDASYSQHAARLLVHDESVRQASAVVLAFRALEPPAYACLYCDMAFALYKSHWTHQRTCDKNVTRQFPPDGSPEDDEVLRKALEDEAVAAAVAFGVEHVHAYVATPSGRRVLRREMQRVKRLTPQRANAATKIDSMRLHYLFHSYDLDESGYLDRREFAEIARDLGEVTTPSTFDALDMTGTGKLSFAIFEKWATSLNMTTATGPMAVVRRFKRLWTRVVYGNKAQRRAEALRYVIAREKKFIETKTRREFRKVFPPRYQCSDCQADAIAIHTRQKEMLASLHHRIGLTDTVKSVLQVAADETKDTEMNAAVQRYLHTISGQHAVNSTALTLRALRIQTHTSTGTQGDAFVAGLVRLLACIDDRKDPEWMDEDQDLVSMTQARAWVRRFKTYLSTADGKVTLAQEITALKQRLDPKGPIESLLTSSTLRYYELDVRKGELDLRDCSPKSIQVLPRDATYTGTNGTLWRFAVQTPKRRMLFSAASEMEMNVWVRHLHLALAIQRSDFTTIQRLATLQSRNSARVPSSPRPRNSGIGGTPPTLSPRGALPDGSHAVVLRAYRKRTNEMEAFVQAVVSKSCELSDITICIATGYYLHAGSSKANLSIMASTNLWQSLLRDSSVRAPIPSTQVLLLGGTEVGKSSLLQRWQGAKNPNERVQTLAVLPSDFTSFHVPSEEDPACQLNVWSVNTDGISSELSFLSLAIDAQKLRHTVALVAIDGSKPWTVKSTLEKVYITGWTFPLIRDIVVAVHGQPSTPSLVKDDDLAKSLPDGVLTHNAGIPVVVVVFKSDDTVKADFIQYTIRHLALACTFIDDAWQPGNKTRVDGAAVCFTSSKTGANLDVLKDYVMHRSHPNAFKCAQPPKALLHPEIRVDPNQVWLRKLEKAAGAGLFLDVNPKHLANFFNNLLSRPDKQKGARLGSIADKAKAAKDVKELAEEEMKKM
ncbi:hypothetical protein DYB34_000862 [Aphanomyces astaci]|uniref:EF-hand domain-containing protein n=1 Tax=Aphanomyces astaci TaxID=112090 RepID=A0A418BZY5_APHAT|nr:hypothetical protein DYB34_000862 [Aphanomyces astaci]